jgi:C-terminal processing protease CtpA/Prc
MIRLLPSSHLAIIPGSLYMHVERQATDPPTKSGIENRVAEEDDDESGSTGLSVTVIGSSVVVESVDQRSPAARAGVHRGWIVHSVDHMELSRVFTDLRDVPEVGKNELITGLVRSRLSGPVGSHAAIELTTGEGRIVRYDMERQESPGELVHFGYLPPEHVDIRHYRLENGVGYIRLNLFLDPVQMMPEIERAVTEFSNTPGIVLDIRDNPGGLGIMAMGIAG